MTVQHIYSRVKKIFPDVEFAEVVALINDAFDDGDDILKGFHMKKINVVNGQLRYPLGDEVIVVKRVFYQNKDGNYKPIPRLIGRVDTGHYQ